MVVFWVESGRVLDRIWPSTGPVLGYEGWAAETPDGDCSVRFRMGTLSSCRVLRLQKYSRGRKGRTA